MASTSPNALRGMEAAGTTIIADTADFSVSLQLQGS
jgi:hypothetical protein